MTLSAFCSAARHVRRLGRSRSGSTCRRYSADRRARGGGRAGGARVHADRADLRQARSGVRQHADLAQPAAVAAGGQLEQAGALVVGGHDAAGDVQQRPRGVLAARAVRQALAVENHDVLAGIDQHLRERQQLLLVGPGCGGQLADDAAAAERGVQRSAERFGAAGCEAHDGCGVGVQRRGPRRRDRKLHAVAAHALADAQVEDRGVVDRLAVEHEHGVGELEVGHRRLQARSVQGGMQLARQRPAEARVDVRRAQRAAHELLQQPALLVGRLAAGDRAQCRSPRRSARRRPRRARGPS